MAVTPGIEVKVAADATQAKGLLDSVADAIDRARRNVECAICGHGFTADEWDARHTVDTGSTEAHAACCNLSGPCSTMKEALR